MPIDTSRSMVAPRLDRGRPRAAIEDAFTELALHPARGFHFICGAPLAARLGYTDALLAGLPPQAMASFSGVGNPFRAGLVHPGEHVLDVGCGSGTDLLVAARLAGAAGSAVGVDMTPAMVERALQAVQAAGTPNACLLWGHAESLPLPDAPST